MSTKNHPISTKLGTQLHIWNRWQPDDQIWKFSKFKMANGLHFKNRFGHSTAPDLCPTSVKLCREKQNSMAMRSWKYKMASRHIANRKLAISQRKIIRLFNEIWYTNANLELWNIKIFKFKTADVSHFKNRFSAIGRFQWIFCVRKQFFAEFRLWNRYVRSTERIFCFPNAFLASADGACRIVSDTLAQ